MSGQSENTSEDTEIHSNAANQSSEQSKSEIMINSEPAMLEDEEMPTYISVPSPSRREGSNVSTAKQQEERVTMDEEHSRSPYHSDQGDGSVYVLSSGDDSDHPPYNDEEEDEYADSDDMDEMNLESEDKKAMLEEEEEEDEEDDEEGNPLRMNPDEDEDEDKDDIEGEFESECFDRVSDDFILNNRLQKHHKERSLSLQDLSVTKNNIRSPYNKKRHSLNIFRQNYLSTQQSSLAYHLIHRKHSMPLKYRHVESKVKRYIKDIKEQNRRSIERRIKDEEHIVSRNHAEIQKDMDEQVKPAFATKSLKDYARKTISELQREEDNVYNTEEMLENGEAEENNAKIEESKDKSIQSNNEMNIYCDVVQNERNCGEKTEKRNGSVDVSAHHTPYQGSLDRSMRFCDLSEPCLVNGHQQAPTLFNLRTLSYEEYMRGTSNIDKENMNKQINAVQETVNAMDMNTPEADNSNIACSLKIENVKSIRMTSDETKPGQENYNFTKVNDMNVIDSENSEITQLKTQLNQKTAQLDNLRDAYQKTLAENMRMMQELDTLKKSLEKYKNCESKSSETKVASVQTEIVLTSVLQKEPAAAAGESNNNKISTSSVASTISSVEQWTDSTCSPAISIKPPDVTTVLQSDDSIVLTESTPGKTARPLSRAFITSSRILQTLSNITQGKTKPESPLVSNTRKRANENTSSCLLNIERNSPIQASSSKKRKATDMLGSSTVLQPFKIPHTSVESQRRKSISTIDVELKCSDESTGSKSEQTNLKTVNISRSNSPTRMENKTEETDDITDNVKCFVYHEDENNQDRSFLIQADEPLKDHTMYDRNRIRECGPYLLGNVEVRMSEVNGTISIWGKEISQESITQNEEELDVSLKVEENKTCHCWQKTQHTRFNGSPLLCSTNKKLKLPSRFSGSGTSACSHSMPNTIKNSFLMDDIDERKHNGNSYSPNTHPYENCDSAQYHKELPTCKHISNSHEKLHSCCSHHIEYNDKECNCTSYTDRQKYSDTPNRSKDKIHVRNNRRCSCRNAIESKKHLQDNFNEEVDEITSKCNTSRCSQHSPAEPCQQNSKYCNTIRDISYTCKSSLVNSSSDNVDRHSCNQSPFKSGDEEPLIPQKRSNEAHEIRQRRLSGKKVRGILMDLLRSCGDFRSPTGPTGPTGGKNMLQEKEIPYLVNGPPQIKISACESEHTCSSHTQSSDRCCHAYARRIESQLEQFRMEMERVRSRSDAILDMLSMLHSVDTN